jgi:hypothetical protein
LKRRDNLEALVVEVMIIKKEKVKLSPAALPPGKEPPVPII